MANRVSVRVDGDDQLSPLLDRIQGKIRSGVFEANLLGGALNQAFGAANRAVGFLTSGIQAASAAQTDIIKSVGSLAETLGKPYETAEKLNADITAGLAKYAAALPGETDTYIRLFRSVSDDVAETNKQMNKGTVNVEQYKEQVTDLTAKFAALGDGLNFGQLTNSISGLLGGQSIASLKQLEFFQRNPKFLKSMESLLKGKELKSLTSGERLEMTLKALDMSLTDDTIKRLGGTFDGAIQGVKTKLFDPNTGIFGLLRDLDENMSGQQSAFDAINQATQALIGSDGLFFVLGETLGKLGLDLGDPMLALRNGALWATTQIRQGATFLQQFGEHLEDGVDAARQIFLTNLGGQIRRVSGQIFNWVGQNAPRLINGLLDAAIFAVRGLAFVLANINWGAAVQAIGTALAGIDWGKALLAVGTVLSANLAASLAIALGSAALGKILATAAVAKLTTMAPAFAATLFGPVGIAAAAIGTLVASQYIANWDSVTLGISYSWSQVGAEAMASLNIVKFTVLNWILDLRIWWLTLQQNVAQGFQGAITLISMGWTNLVAGVSATVAQFAATVMGWISSLSAAWASLQQNVSSAITGLIQSVVAGFQSVQATVDGAIQGVISTVGNVFSSIQNAFSSLMSRIPFVGGGTPAGGAVAARAGGQIPNAAGGLNIGAFLDAVGREVGLMPRGATPVVANSSELILNRQQQGALAASMAQPQTGGGLSIGNITIHTHATDAQGIARDLMAQIANEFRLYQQSRLSTAF